MAGEVVGSLDDGSLAARYGAARNFLSQQDHMSHPYLPRATAANLLVRRSALEEVGGFYEGLRAAEDRKHGVAVARVDVRVRLLALLRRGGGIERTELRVDRAEEPERES